MPLDSSTQISLALPTGTFQVWDEYAPGRTREVFAKDQQSNQAQITLLSAWSDRKAIALGLLGNTIAVAGTAAYQLAFPYPDFAAFVCNRVEISGDGLPSVGPNGILAYQRARMRCVFGVPPYIPGDPKAMGEVELDFVSNTTAMNQAQTAFQFSASDVIPPSQMPALNFVTVLFSLTRYEQPSIPLSSILGAVSCVNSATIFGAAPETLLFHGAKTSRSTTPAGGLNWSINYALEWKGVTMAGTTASWNKLWKPGTGWTSFTDTAGHKLFTPVDLSFITT